MNEYQFADNLLEAIQGAGMTQKAFAQHMGVHPNTVYGWTRGNRIMSAYELLKASQILGRPMEVLMRDVRV